MCAIASTKNSFFAAAVMTPSIAKQRDLNCCRPLHQKKHWPPKYRPAKGGQCRLAEVDVIPELVFRAETAGPVCSRACWILAPWIRRLPLRPYAIALQATYVSRYPDARSSLRK